jgi:hypothetical protein
MYTEQSSRYIKFVVLFESTEIAVLKTCITNTNNVLYLSFAVMMHLMNHGASGRQHSCSPYIGTP